jgi:hypothetical protein
VSRALSRQYSYNRKTCRNTKSYCRGLLRRRNSYYAQARRLRSACSRYSRHRSNRVNRANKYYRHYNKIARKYYNWYRRNYRGSRYRNTWLHRYYHYNHLARKQLRSRN